MMKIFSKNMAWVCLVVISFTIYGCGGGGGGSDDEMMTGGGDMMPTTPDPIECPAGQEPNAANDACVDTAETIAAKAVAATKAAATMTEVVADEATQGPGQSPTNDDAGLGGSAADGSAVDTYSMTIARDRDGTTITIADSAMAGDDDPKFAQAMDLGGGTTMHVRDNGMGVEEVVMVHTDIEAPTPTAFAMVAGQAPTIRKDGVAVDADNPADSIAVDGDDASVLALIMASEFGSVPNVLTKNFSGDNTDTEDMDEADEVSGTYNGASGTYRCNVAAGCTVTYNAMGMIAGLGTDGDWIFTPDAGATSDVPDSDYLNYGFWLQRTTDKDGAVTYDEVETFAGSSVDASSDVSGVTGSATYSGGALGVYVHRVSKPDGTIGSATSGHFTADVALTATFGQVNNEGGIGTIAPSLLNTLSGTINNFMLSGHDVGPGWSVALAGAIASGAATGSAKGGMGDGSFSATFHGDVTAVDDTVPKPHTVIGEFNAGFSNGSVAGAFGARKE